MGDVLECVNFIEHASGTMTDKALGTVRIKYNKVGYFLDQNINTTLHYVISFLLVTVLYILID